VGNINRLFVTDKSNFYTMGGHKIHKKKVLPFYCQLLEESAG